VPIEKYLFVVALCALLCAPSVFSQQSTTEKRPVSPVVDLVPGTCAKVRPGFSVRFTAKVKMDGIVPSKLSSDKIAFAHSKLTESEFLLNDIVAARKSTFPEESVIQEYTIIGTLPAKDTTAKDVNGEYAPNEIILYELINDNKAHGLGPSVRRFQLADGMDEELKKLSVCFVGHNVIWWIS
jgi:hypothetical protein